MALVELSLILPGLLMVIFSAVDLGHTAQIQNRMLNAARAGAAVAMLSPRAVDTGCHGDRNVVDRVAKQDPTLVTEQGYSVTIAKKDATTGALSPYAGCDTSTPAGPISSGDHILITVTADIAMYGPVSVATVGRVMHLKRHIEIVVQG